MFPFDDVIKKWSDDIHRKDHQMVGFNVFQIIAVAVIATKIFNNYGGFNGDVANAHAITSDLHHLP